MTQNEFTLLCDQLGARVKEVEGLGSDVRKRMAAALQQKENECIQVRLIQVQVQSHLLGNSQKVGDSVSQR